VAAGTAVKTPLNKYDLLRARPVLWIVCSPYAPKIAAPAKRELG
jgi:hypothetical protein